MRAPLLTLALALAGCAAPALEPALTPGATPQPLALVLLPPVELPNPPRGAFEPSVAVDGAGNVLVAAAMPFEPAPLWASHDDGATFRRVHPTGLPAGTEGQPAFSPDGDAYVVDDGVAGLVVARSRDAGETWEVRSVAALAVPGGDRPWIAAGSGGRLYATWNQLPTGQWVAASDDGGATFPVQTPLGGEFVVTGPMTVAPDGALLLARAESEGPALYVSRDGARTFERHLAWRTEGVGGWLFATPAVDAEGHVYLVTIDRLPEGTRARYAVSTDGGATFGPPRDLTTQPGVHVHAWSAAGPEGRLAVAFYENPTARGVVPDEADGAWYVRLVVVEDAHTDAPRVREARVVETPVYEGTVCTGGTTSCTGVCFEGLPCPVGRPQGDFHLGDYLGVAMAPDGAAHVVFQDVEKGSSVWHARTAAPAETVLSPREETASWS